MFKKGLHLKKIICHSRVHLAVSLGIPSQSWRNCQFVRFKLFLPDLWRSGKSLEVLIIKWTYAYNWQKETIFCLHEIFPQKSCKYIWVIASIMISSSAGSKLLKIPFDSTSSPALKVGTIWISHCDFLGFQKASRKKNHKQEFMALCQKLFWSCLLCKNI